MEIWLVFQYLLRPPNEAGFSVHWCFAPRSTVEALWQLQFSHFYRACPGVPETTRVPKFHIFGTLWSIWRCPEVKIHKLATFQKNLFQSSQFGDFDQNHTNKLFFSKKINSGILQDHRQVLLAIFGDLWASPDTLRVPDKSARIPTVKELQPSIAARNANELKNQPHLEAVAVIKKPIIFPYSAYKLALNGLCNTSGAFCSSKTVYFWGVWPQ